MVPCLSEAEAIIALSTDPSTVGTGGVHATSTGRPLVFRLTYLSHDGCAGMQSRNIALATACGERKRQGHWPLHLLYESPRVKALYSRKGNFPLYILSAEYGFVDCEEVRASYDRRMDLNRAEQLAPQVAEAMGGFDWVVFFNAQTPREYAFCLERASDICGVPVAFIGWWPLGGLNECLLVARHLSRGEPPETSIRSLRLYGVPHGQR